MTDTAGFLLACLHAPLDAAPRLVFSDHLEDRGWDAMRLAALRGEGEWEVNADGLVGWRFYLGKLMAALYPDDSLHVPPAMYDLAFLRFGHVPATGPTCACGATVGLRLWADGWMPTTEKANAKWRCVKAGCRWPPHTVARMVGVSPRRYSWPLTEREARESPTAAALWELVQFGVNIPDAVARQMLGLEPPAHE